MAKSLDFAVNNDMLISAGEMQ
ncbi:hypothetical protein OIHEL45_11575 [Sulfitobacter indolifex HEL-45]|uniref:Uncharacterized protein n=1 Tax=Sulfitobacter indolifex HEL-45 TaxID=391624 RepID=A0ABP2D9K6_9RHOB|nr:hypothetical protein OIHEL45_11575 [Sulfitobacter indolifex HEL-45]